MLTGNISSFGFCCSRFDDILESLSSAVFKKNVFAQTLLPSHVSAQKHVNSSHKTVFYIQDCDKNFLHISLVSINTFSFQA